jgi:rubrerythrin
MAMLDPIPSSRPVTTIADEHSINAVWVTPIRQKRIYTCDRCGVEMNEKNCKVICPNCGNRFDCSDLNIYFD